MAVGERDLALGLPSLRRLAGQAGLRLVSANLHHAVSGTVAFSRFALIERGGRTLGVVAASPVFGPEDPQREAYVWAGLEARAPGPALSAAVAEARAAGASEVVALLHLPAVVAEGLLPTLDVEAAIIAHDRGPGRAAGRLGWLPGRGRAFAEVNLRGKAAQVALRPVAAPMPEDAAIAAAIDLAQQPQAPDAPAYMGNRACAAKCHAEALRHYDKTGHAKAFERLRAERQTRNRDCLPCHTTGYARPGGPRFSVAIRKFRNVGCESCHPPMPAHAEAPEVNRMGPVDHLVCAQCHRLQAYQRPFELGARWKAVLGPGHGL